MIADLQPAVREGGLGLHHGKTKISANSKGLKQAAGTHLGVNGNQTEILQPASCTKYLERALVLHDYHDHEVNHWIAAGWPQFTLLKTELFNRKLAVQKRLKLVEAVVTPTVMYGSACCTTTAARRQILLTFLELPGARYG